MRADDASSDMTFQAIFIFDFSLKKLSGPVQSQPVRRKVRKTCLCAHERGARLARRSACHSASRQASAYPSRRYSVSSQVQFDDAKRHPSLLQAVRQLTTPCLLSLSRGDLCEANSIRKQSQQAPRTLHVNGVDVWLQLLYGITSFSRTRWLVLSRKIGQ